MQPLLQILKTTPSILEIPFYGNFSAKGGMFEYLLCWTNELSTLGIDFKILSTTNMAHRRLSAYQQENASNSLNSREILKWTLLAQGYKKLLWRFFKTIPFSKKGVAFITNANILAVPLIDYLIHEFPEKKVIYTLHDPIRHEEKTGRLARWIKNRQEKMLKKLLTKQNNLYLHVHDLCLVENIPHLANNPKVLEYQHPYPKRLTSIKDTFTNPSFRIGFLGRIEDYKGVDVLFESLQMIAKVENYRKKEITVVIAGHNNTSFNLNQFNELPWNIEIHDSFISDKDFHELMSNLNLLVLPYKDATQSGVVLMGLAYEIPVVASSVGAIANLLASHPKGSLVPPNKPSLLAEAIKEWLRA